MQKGQPGSDRARTMARRVVLGVDALRVRAGQQAPLAGLDDRTTGTIVALEETLDALDGLLKLLPEGRRSFL